MTTRQASAAEKKPKSRATTVEEQKDETEQKTRPTKPASSPTKKKAASTKSRSKKSESDEVEAGDKGARAKGKGRGGGRAGKGRKRTAAAMAEATAEDEEGEEETEGANGSAQSAHSPSAVKRQSRNSRPAAQQSADESMVRVSTDEESDNQDGAAVEKEVKGDDELEEDEDNRDEQEEEASDEEDEASDEDKQSGAKKEKGGKKAGSAGSGKKTSAALSKRVKSPSPPPPPPRKPRPQKGQRIERGLTDNIMIQVPTRIHLHTYAGIAKAIEKEDAAKLYNNKLWKEKIAEAFLAIGDKATIKDLESSPWAENITNLHSARSRAIYEYEWRKKINLEPKLAAGRKALNHPPQPYTEEYRLQWEAAKKERADKRKKKAKKEEEDQ